MQIHKTAFAYTNKPDDGTCNYCGSLLPDEFISRLDAGDISLEPTDKNYKIYVHNKGGQTFRQSYRIDHSKSLDQNEWVYQTKNTDRTKFYFYHLTESDKRHFVGLLNSGNIEINYPHYFYVTPYFIIYNKE